MVGLLSGREFAGLAGAVSLLLKRRWAASLFILSLAAAVVQFGWLFTAGRAAELLGPSAAIFPVAIIFVGVALVWLARRADRNGWLR